MCITLPRSNACVSAFINRFSIESVITITSAVVVNGCLSSFVFANEIKLYNLNFGINEKIEYMGWVNEGVLNNNHPWQSYCARFMIIRGRDVLLFDIPPVSALFERTREIYVLRTRFAV